MSSEYKDSQESIQQETVEVIENEDEQYRQAILDEASLLLEKVEADVEEKSLKVKNKLIITVILIILVASMVFTIGYRVFPTTQKVKGTWHAEEDVPYTFILRGNQGKLVVDKLNGLSGVCLEVRSNIEAIDGQHYKGKDTAVYLVVDKTAQSKEIINALKKKTEYYQITNETKNTLELLYTKEATLVAFGVEDLTPLFRFEVTDWYSEIIPKTIHMPNEAFAKNGITFKK